MQKLIIFFLLILCSISYSQDFDKLADAVVNKDLVKVDSLIKSGIDVNMADENKGATVLLIACSFKGYEKIIQFLISNGADVNYKSKDGKTPLMLAAGTSFETTKVLIENGADVNTKAEDGMTAFFHATFGVLSKKVTTGVMDLLLEYEVDINYSLTGKDAAGWTALLFATINEDKDLVKYLILHGADVNHISDDGVTTLSLAKQENFTSLVKLLKKHGALD